MQQLIGPITVTAMMKMMTRLFEGMMGGLVLQKKPKAQLEKPKMVEASGRPYYTAVDKLTCLG